MTHYNHVLVHDTTPPSAIHADGIIRANGDAETRVLVVVAAPVSPQCSALGFAPLRLYNKPGRATVGVFLLHELEWTRSIPSSRAWRFRRRWRDKDGMEPRSFDGEVCEGYWYGERFNEGDFLHGER